MSAHAATSPFRCCPARETEIAVVKKRKSMLHPRSVAARLDKEVGVSKLPPELRYSAAVVLELAQARARRDRAPLTKTERKLANAKRARTIRNKKRAEKQAREKARLKGKPVASPRGFGVPVKVWALTQMPDHPFTRLQWESEARENPLIGEHRVSLIRSIVCMARGAGWLIWARGRYRITEEGRAARAWLTWASARTACLGVPMPRMRRTGGELAFYVRYWIRGESLPVPTNGGTTRPSAGYLPGDPADEAWPDLGRYALEPTGGP